MYSSDSAVQMLISLLRPGVVSSNTAGHEASSETFHKDPTFYGALFLDTGSLLDARLDSYKDQRRIMRYALSRKVLFEQQQPVIVSCINDTLKHLKGFEETGENIPLDKWIGNFLLDLSGKIAMGRDFGALECGNRLHPYLHRMEKGVYVLEIFVEFMRILPTPVASFIQSVLGQILPNMLRKVNFLGPKLVDRLEKGSINTDFVSHMLAGQNPAQIDTTYIFGNVSLLVLGLPETSRAFLTASVYYLLSNPLELSKVSALVRKSFSSKNDITAESTQRKELKYMHCFMDEVRRIYPAPLLMVPRIVPDGGTTICGTHVPPGVIVGVHHWATYHSDRNFENAESFIPERWLGEDYADNKKEFFHPFGYGASVCVGKEISMTVSRLFLAHLLWEFDMELDSRSCDWANQTGHLAPRAGELLVKIKARSIEREN
ncbi:hypothetical protein sscle_09g070470 [Sclerotinia sclerotiorum 1980 UF-70]|uniref:Cytochrome P450 n=1 Tax=Sclerotinia sclerotiorum (strain ATCC 18683 / 1980 / Ss-1) TaxID=665079 RepID=A0A1D9QBG7_SCLS1|nr:hypothetical protein sscle_09g070470 [Sclerotinia sclerotiorum 1980 UF-70]